MSDEYRGVGHPPQDLVRKFKDTGLTDPQGRIVYAEVMALEAGSIGGGGSNTQYAEGTTQATPTGTVMLWRDGSNVLRAANPSNGLPVNIVGGAGGGTASSFGSAFPGSGTAAGFSDGTNMQGARVFDVDTGAGFQYVLGVALKKPASGGSVDFGTSTDPVRVDPTGTTTQPVSGTVTVQQSTASNLKVDLSGTAANATAIKVDGSAVTQPVSIAATVTVADNQVITDNAAFTDGTSKVFMGGHIFDEVAGTALTENDAAASRINANRAQVFVLEDETTRGRRAVVTASNALKVDGSAVTQPVSISGNQAINLVQLNGTTVDTNSGNKSAGTQRHVIATDQPNLTTPLNVTPQGQAATGATTARLASSAATTNATSTKASAGTLYGVHVLNTNAAVRYVHFYDKASSPTVGTDTPIITIPVPPNNGGIVRTWITGAKFASGIAYAMTTDAAAGNNAVASGDLVGLHFDYT